MFVLSKMNYNISNKYISCGVVYNNYIYDDFENIFVITIISYIILFISLINSIFTLIFLNFFLHLEINIKLILLTVIDSIIIICLFFDMLYIRMCLLKNT